MLKHRMLQKVLYICVCEHPHLYITLCSARPCRATPFKEKKAPILGAIKKAKARKNIRTAFYLSRIIANGHELLARPNTAATETKKAKKYKRTRIGRMDTNYWARPNTAATETKKAKDYNRTRIGRICRNCWARPYTAATET